ncbi:S1C family serine protease [Papillibacter cinnamivorans]|uniref:Serine protease Do n=1 Tax=Papillibacter cinnamivorans DSM 12816 TaxID=1122930 RepID=A0A1W2AB30_9FIRM|nr:trypsin-like peptidase domain-containing protein [Papillibacter cinnamivorans]SMC57820.1 serine protease Do [Papillibacter cinnamivorans DSM 12816]
MWEEEIGGTGKKEERSGETEGTPEKTSVSDYRAESGRTGHTDARDERQYSAWESRYQRQPSPEPDNRTPWEEAPYRSRRRKRSGPLFLIIAVLLIVGISVFIRYSLVNGTPWQPYGSLPSLPFVTSPSSGQQEETTGQTTVERAPVGDGTTLTISSPPGKALTIQDVYREVSPSVVSIMGTLPDATAYGTGIIMSADGYVITNYHVIEGSSAVTVTLQDDEEFDAKLVGGDAQTDLAVLKIDSENLPAAKFGDSGALVVGDSVYAIGNPLGVELKGTLTDGIISAINRDIYVDGRTMTLLQTNAALNSGNSGGPLINVYGQIIGINTIKMSSYSSTIEGLGFAIPISSAKPIIDELIAKGYISGRSAIGITVSDLSDTAAAFYKNVRGAYVESVDTRSNAYKAGMRQGDIITVVNGVEIQSVDDLYAAKEDCGVGDTISVTVYRNGKYLDFEIVLMDASDLS